ncbi:uncharacterized protein SPSC_00075 [Sporisorium scitamineum]|uniref:Uncharacterized protein n=1 Tax=Sporisorium scitamineum TaxID=49012 RepID=A0A0F7S258_9BASI|nr:hypothetical protein [Sporisorium scitamineum]CDS81889.1 uncharacterized protein SPSC_00075 [Sporisorium scitamineum]
MKLFTFFTAACVAVTAVFAIEESSTSPDSSPFTVQLQHSPEISRDYVHRLQLIRQDYKLPSFDANRLGWPRQIDSQTMQHNLISSRDHPRFVYLGQPEWNKPEMALATPVTLQAKPDGSHYWALMTVKPPPQGGVPDLAVHGFVKVPDGAGMFNEMNSHVLSREAVLDKGHTLTIDQVLSELSLLKGPTFGV